MKFRFTRTERFIRKETAKAQRFYDYFEGLMSLHVVPRRFQEQAQKWLKMFQIIFALRKTKTNPKYDVIRQMEFIREVTDKYFT